MKKIARKILLMALMLNASFVFGKEPDINKLDKNGQTALIKAIRYDEFDEAKRLIEAGADVNKHGKGEYSALYEACARENTTGIIKMLVDHGAKVNEKFGSDGGTPLIQALKNSTDEAVEYLITHGAKIDVRDGNNCFPLNYGYDQPDRIFNMLLNEKVDVNQIDAYEGWSPVIRSFYNSNVSRINELKKYKIDYTVQREGKNLLFVMIEGCSRNGKLNKDLVQLLVANGIDINSKNKKNETALMLACEDLDVDSVKTLIECGADVNAVDKDGRTCFYHAMGSMTIMKYLISRGVNPKVKDKDGISPYKYACECQIWNYKNNDSSLKDFDFAEIVSFLLKYADASERPSSIYEAALLGDVEVVGKLLPDCKDINAHDKDKNYIIYNAVLSGSPETVQMILERKPDLTKINKEEVMPVLFKALKKRYYKITEELLKAGCNPNQLFDYYEGVIGNYISPIRFVMYEHNIRDGSQSAEGKSGYDFIKLLLDNGADPNQKYGTGTNESDPNLVDNDFMNIFRDSKESNVVDLMLEHGIDPFVIGKEGDCPAEIAKTNYDLEIWTDYYWKFFKAKYDEKYLNKNATALDNLRFRKNPDLGSKVVDTFKKGTKLKIIDYNIHLDEIDGITDCWVKVEAGASAMNSDGQAFGKKVSGWCFAGYLSIK